MMLAAYSSYRKHPPTIAGLFAKNWKRHAVFTLYCAALAYLVYAVNMTVLIWFIVGAWWGYLWTTFTYLRYTSNVWPVLGEIIDWKKVDQLSSPGAAAVKE